MRSTHLLLPIVTTMAFITGCGTPKVPPTPLAHVNYRAINPAWGNGPPRAPEEVKLFTTSRPTRHYSEAGILEVSGDGDLIARMQNVAAQRGCDGLILLGSNNVVEHTPVYRQEPLFGDRDRRTIETGGYAYTVRGERGTCIVWTESPTEKRTADAVKR